MNLKLVIGIFLPLVLIIALVVMSSVNTGLSIEKDTPKEIAFEDIFSKTSSLDEATIQTLTIQNDYFLSKRVDLPQVMVCLYDKENKIKSPNLYATYNEGNPSNIPDNPITGIMADSYGDGSNGYTTKRNLDISAHSSQQVKLIILQVYYISPSKEFDDILIVETDEDSYAYDACTRLSEDELQKADRITIIKNPDVIKEYEQSFYQQNSPKQSIQTATNTVVGDTMVYSKQTIKNISDCDVYSGEYKDICITDFAIKTSDSNLCLNVVAAWNKDDCYGDIGIKTKNLSICDLTPGYFKKNQCKLEVIPTLQNPDLCDQLPQPAIKDCRFEVVTFIQNPDLCNQFPDGDSLGQKNNCLYRIALNFKNKSICQMMNHGGLYNICIGNS